VNAAAKQLDMQIRWEGTGVDEKGYLINPSSQAGEVDVATQKPIIQVDEKYFRPTEVETLLGDPSKAKQKLGWTPKITFEALVSEMVSEDYKTAQRDELIKKHGFQTMDYHE
jgi:GDPmannose 4,6-dehydratase